jgi:hypothetical protein
MATTYKYTKLQAVNIILSNIGQAPVTTLSSVNPMVSTALGILNEVTTSALGEGWTFNTERAYPLLPDIDGHILVPENVISYDSHPNSNQDLVTRNGRLYDKISHTDVFSGEIELDVVWFFDFEDLPQPVRNYITVRAANVFAGRVVGSSEAVRFGQQEEALARAELLEYETQQGDYSFFQSSDGTSPIRTYTPIQVISRY